MRKKQKTKDTNMGLYLGKQSWVYGREHYKVCDSLERQGQ